MQDWLSAPGEKGRNDGVNGRLPGATTLVRAGSRMSRW